MDRLDPPTSPESREVNQQIKSLLARVKTIVDQPPNDVCSVGWEEKALELDLRELLEILESAEYARPNNVSNPYDVEGKQQSPDQENNRLVKGIFFPEREEGPLLRLEVLSANQAMSSLEIHCNKGGTEVSVTNLQHSSETPVTAVWNLPLETISEFS